MKRVPCRVISVAAAGCSTTSSVDGLAMKQEPSATLVASCRAYYADQPGSIGASSFDSSAAGALRGVRAPAAGHTACGDVSHRDLEAGAGSRHRHRSR
jgi:hypothetical protein